MEFWSNGLMVISIIISVCPERPPIMSFRHALSRNPLWKSNGFPIRAFGNDKFGQTLITLHCSSVIFSSVPIILMDDQRPSSDFGLWPLIYALDTLKDEFQHSFGFSLQPSTNIIGVIL
jgi:hypothetical protein